MPPSSRACRWAFRRLTCVRAPFSSYSCRTASSDNAARGIGSRSQPIVNTAILGAFAAWSGLVSLDAICAAIGEEVPTRPEANVDAAREAAAAVVALAAAAEALHA